LGWAELKYWKVHAQLYGENAIEKGRGPGGLVLLVEDGVQTKAVLAERAAVASTPRARGKAQQAVTIASEGAAAEEFTRELHLYDPVKRQLEAHWAKRRQLDQCHVEVTALQGRRDTGGSWSRPDLALVGYRKYEFLPEKVFEVVSFEVKPATDVSIKGVMEALAHREAATRSYVIFHTANEEFEGFPEASRIEELAARHGVGVFAAPDINDFDKWVEIVPAQRASPDPEAVDTFIRRTLSDTAKSTIRRWF
jgi:hypothetical protein